MLDTSAPTSLESRELNDCSSSVCPCCGGSATDVIYSVPSIPVHSCVLLDTPAAARSFPRRDLELCFCDDCGFASNRIFDESAMRYSTDFEESQHFSETFNGFAKELAREIAARCSTAGKRILEIGCGKGEFLAELCEAGDAKGIGIDPGFRADAGRRSANARLDFIVDHFGPRYADLVADVVLCRHTLEHIKPVAGFVRDIRNMIGSRDDTWVVFETPDFKRVLEEGAFWDIYYEHCSYFSPGVHAYLFRKEGFEVTDLALAFSSQYIVQYSRPARGRTSPHLPLERDRNLLRALVDGFGERVRGVQNQWRERIGEAHAVGRRVLLWGGGSKAVSFLTTLGLEDEVQAVVDINPYKQGKFVPGSGHPVVAPGALLKAPPDLVVVMNPIYAHEVRKSLASLDLYPEVLAV